MNDEIIKNLAQLYANANVRIEQLERENAALRSLLREAITDYVDPYDLPETEDYVLRVKAALGEAKP